MNLTRRRRRKGGILLELVLSLPFSLILIFIVVDVGRLMLAGSALHDAVAVSARAGARIGNVGGNPVGTGGAPCTGNVERTAVSYHAFCQSAANIPGAELVGFRILAPSSGASQDSYRYCRTDDLYVTVAATAEFEFLTDVVARGGQRIIGIDIPGLGSVLRSERNGMTGALHAVGTARCEVAR